MKIVCPYCPSSAGPPTIEVSEANQTVICGTCLRRYTTATRQLRGINSRRLQSGRYAYKLRTLEPSGAQRLRRLEAQEGLRLIAGTTITMVWRGARLVGIADQNSGTWFWIDPANAVHPHPKLERYLRWSGYMVIALLALQLTRFFPEAGETIRKAPLTVLVGAALVTLLIAMPSLLWTVQTYFGPEGGRKRLLPGLQTELDDAVVEPLPEQISVAPAPDSGAELQPTPPPTPVPAPLPSIPAPPDDDEPERPVF
jgi:hypothetical protein